MLLKVFGYKREHTISENECRTLCKEHYGNEVFLNEQNLSLKCCQGQSPVGSKDVRWIVRESDEVRNEWAKVIVTEIGNTACPFLTYQCKLLFAIVCKLKKFTPVSSSCYFSRVKYCFCQRLELQTRVAWVRVQDNWIIHKV